MREKLIELMTDLPCHAKTCLDCEFFNTEECYRRQKEIIADHLIANGVTIPVRCGECKGWCTEEIAKHYGVDRYCTMTMMPTNADDFCSMGERSEGR